jgi:hypothetical protein
MVVPPYAGGGLHAVWPGLENESAGFVFQSVVSDSNGNGWTFFVEYCCKYGFFLSLSLKKVLVQMLRMTSVRITSTRPS